MKGAILFSIFFMGFVILFAVTNPSTEEFYYWYSYTYENQFKVDVANQIEASFKTDSDILNTVIDGIYTAFGKDKVGEVVDKVLKSNRDKIQIKRSLFFTDYVFPLPNGRTVHAIGIINSFAEVPG